MSVSGEQEQLDFVRIMSTARFSLKLLCALHVLHWYVARGETRNLQTSGRNGVIARVDQMADLGLIGEMSTHRVGFLVSFSNSLFSTHRFPSKHRDQSQTVCTGGSALPLLLLSQSQSVSGTGAIFRLE